MKKTISIMTISLLTATTLASASPSDQMDFSTLNQSDAHMLFGTNNSNVITLEQNEMAKTEGEWGWKSFVAVLINPTVILSTAVSVLRPDETVAGVAQIASGNIYSGIGTIGQAAYSIYNDPTIHSPTIKTAKNAWGFWRRR